MSLTLSGCFLKDIIFPGGSITPEVVSLTKTKLKYTYQDLSNNHRYAVDSTPLSGNPKLLIVPIWFTNSNKYISSSYKERVRDDIRKSYLGTDEETGWKSVSSFYYEESKGKLNLDGVVTDWYECGLSSTKFYSEQNGGVRTMNLVSEVVDWYKSAYNDPTMESFDADENGYIDGVILIYGAPDYGSLSTSSDSSNMWAYCYWLQRPRGTPTNPVPNSFFWASYDFMYGPTNKVGDYAAGDTSHCALDTHTYIHEMGHVLGLDDYYDYSGKYKPAGAFSMQDYNVGGHDPYSVMAFGWADPYVPTETCSISIKPFQDSHDIILLSPNFGSKSPFDEYLLLEFYTPTGLNKFDTDYHYTTYYPQGPKISGIRLWHVDGRLLRDGQIVTDIIQGGYHQHVMSNTYYMGSDMQDYYSPLGEEYCDYNLLQLIRNNTKATYKPTSYLTGADLFTKGDKFTMSKYSGQFVNGSKLNSRYTLGWSFKVDSISSEEAVITVTRG